MAFFKNGNGLIGTETGKSGISSENDGMKILDHHLLNNSSGKNIFVYKTLAPGWKILLSPGKFLGTILGFVIGIFLNFGTFGKAVLSALLAFSSFIIFWFLLSMIPLVKMNNEAFNIACIGIILVFAMTVSIWFWKYYFDELKDMTITVFADLISLCFSIWAYGSIIFVLFDYYITGSRGPISALGIFGFLIIAAIIWLIKTRAEEDKPSLIDSITRAALSGDPEAQYDLCWAYWDGNDIKRDIKKSYYWCQKAADNGIAEAQYYIGLAYAAGQYGYPYDLGKAHEWLSRAASQGLNQAKIILKEVG